MPLPALITILALFLYLGLIWVVGVARGKYGVPAPATTGNLEFEKRLRVQQNTLEQLIIFLPALWMFAYILERPGLASIIGAVWLVGRVIYALSYFADPKKRALGFVIAQLASVVLLLGALWGVLVKLAIH